MSRLRNTLKIKLFLIVLSLFLATFAYAKTMAEKATETEISLVDGIALDKKGNIYIAMREHNVISRIDTKGVMTRFAGSGEAGFSGDGGPAINARFMTPAGLTFDSRGNLYIADRDNHRVRKIDTRGNITTFAGTGKEGFSGDGGPAVKADLNLPSGLAADGKGNIFISDRSNDRIRVVDKKGNIRTYAGSGVAGFQGDAGPALKAQLDKPFGIALDQKGTCILQTARTTAFEEFQRRASSRPWPGMAGFSL